MHGIGPKTDTVSVSFDLDGLVTDSLTRMSPQAQAKGLILTADLAPDLPAWVLGSADSVSALLHHLLASAIRRTDQGGVQVGVIQTPDGLLEFSVRDSGFAPDMTTDPDLAACRRLPQGQKWVIRAETLPQLGNRLWVWLPLPPTPDTPAPTPHEQQIIENFGQMFVSGGSQNYDALMALAPDGALDDIRHHAHDLRGMASYVGAHGLVALLSQIEQSATAENDTQTRVRLSQLPATWHWTIGYINDVMGQKNPPY